jgi:hypothetical protein
MAGFRNFVLLIALWAEAVLCCMLVPEAGTKHEAVAHQSTRILTATLLERKALLRTPLMSSVRTGIS